MKWFSFVSFVFNWFFAVDSTMVTDFLFIAEDCIIWMKKPPLLWGGFRFVLNPGLILLWSQGPSPTPSSRLR
jgi:hypothetical protein